MATRGRLRYSARAHPAQLYALENTARAPKIRRGSLSMALGLPRRADKRTRIPADSLGRMAASTRGPRAAATLGRPGSGTLLTVFLIYSAFRFRRKVSGIRVRALAPSREIFCGRAATAPSRPAPARGACFAGSRCAAGGVGRATPRRRESPLAPRLSARRPVFRGSLTATLRGRFRRAAAS